METVSGNEETKMYLRKMLNKTLRQNDYNHIF